MYKLFICSFLIYLDKIITLIGIKVEKKTFYSWTCLLWWGIKTLFC